MDGICAICQHAMSNAPWTCTTNCQHSFCLSCACAQLGRMANRCCICRQIVRVIQQEAKDDDDFDSINEKRKRMEKRMPMDRITIKYCNVLYELHAPVLSLHGLQELFQLKNVRLIHAGKIVHDIDAMLQLPGAKVVQLFGTRQDFENPSHPDSQLNHYYTQGKLLVDKSAKLALQYLIYILSTTFSVLYVCLHSLVSTKSYPRRYETKEQIQMEQKSSRRSEEAEANLYFRQGKQNHRHPGFVAPGRVRHEENDHDEVEDAKR